MTRSDSTHWSLIRGAAEGRAPDREAFAERYESVIRTYLGARWRGAPIIQEIDDAAQEVFVECFRPGGALGRAGGETAFRGFLYGVVRNVARRIEERGARHGVQPGSHLDLAEVEAREEPLSHVFDKAWARALVLQAGLLHAERARANGEEGRRRVEILRLRFKEGKPIREIAELWEEDAAHLHHQYAKARAEFGEALKDVVAEHHPGTPREIAEECARLVSYLK